MLKDEFKNYLDNPTALHIDENSPRLLLSFAGNISQSVHPLQKAVKAGALSRNDDDDNNDEDDNDDELEWYDESGTRERLHCSCSKLKELRARSDYVRLFSLCQERAALPAHHQYPADADDTPRPEMAGEERGS